MPDLPMPDLPMPDLPVQTSADQGGRPNRHRRHRHLALFATLIIVPLLAVIGGGLSVLSRESMPEAVAARSSTSSAIESPPSSAPTATPSGRTSHPSASASSGSTSTGTVGPPTVEESFRPTAPCDDVELSTADQRLRDVYGRVLADAPLHGRTYLLDRPTVERLRGAPGVAPRASEEPPFSPALATCLTRGGLFPPQIEVTVVGPADVPTRQSGGRVEVVDGSILTLGTVPDGDRVRVGWRTDDTWVGTVQPDGPAAVGGWMAGRVDLTRSSGRWVTSTASVVVS